jgi:hypothetical protein
MGRLVGILGSYMFGFYGYLKKWITFGRFVLAEWMLKSEALEEGAGVKRNCIYIRARFISLALQVGT